MKEAYDKEAPPKNLFEATNLIIELDKKCFLKSKMEKETSSIKNKKFSNFNNKRKIQIASSYKSFNKNKKSRSERNNDCKDRSTNILSINYTPDK